jgi:ABC-type phosphate transport system permease subunit
MNAEAIAADNVLTWNAVLLPMFAPIALLTLVIREYRDKKRLFRVARFCISILSSLSPGRADRAQLCYVKP